MTEEPVGAGAPPLGMPGNPLTVTDARMIRALAHPTRIEVLKHLALEGPATATALAAAVGISPSACSYHLRALGRYGFVEADPDAAADGRHHPWRARVISIDIPGADAGAAAWLAGDQLDNALDSHRNAVNDRYRRHRAEYPREWMDGITRLTDIVHVTPDELTALRQNIILLLDRVRRIDPGERPVNGRRFAVNLSLLPDWAPDSE